MQATATVLAEAGLTVEGGSDGGLGQRLAGRGGGRGAADGGQHGDRGAVVCGHAHQRLVGGYPAMVRAGPSRQSQVHAAMHLVMISVITVTCVSTTFHAHKFQATCRHEDNWHNTGMAGYLTPARMPQNPAFPSRPKEKNFPCNEKGSPSGAL